MTSKDFIERIIDQYASDKEREYPQTLQRDIMAYLRRFSDENLNYLWAGLVKTYSRAYKRLPGIKELEAAWKDAVEVKQKNRHPDIDPRMEYKPQPLLEEETADPETVKSFFDELRKITKSKNYREEGEKC